MASTCPVCGQLTLPIDGAADGLCEACARREKRKPKKPRGSELRLHAHPRALTLMAEPFLWLTSDGMAPLGNATARDVHASFDGWRKANPLLPVVECLTELLARWDVKDAAWDVVDGAEVDRMVKWDLVDLMTRDDAAVAIAFSQLVTEGRVDDGAKQRALAALQRESMSSVVTAREWKDPEEWLRRARVMMDVLGRV